MTIRISDELHASLHSLAYQMHVPMQTLVIQGIERIVAEGDTETDNLFEEVENPYTIIQMLEMPMDQLRGYAREIDDGTIGQPVERGTLISAICKSTRQKS